MLNPIQNGKANPQVGFATRLTATTDAMNVLKAKMETGYNAMAPQKKRYYFGENSFNFKRFFKSLKENVKKITENIAKEIGGTFVLTQRDGKVFPVYIDPAGKQFSGVHEIGSTTLLANKVFDAGLPYSSAVRRILLSLGETLEKQGKRLEDNPFYQVHDRLKLTEV